MAEESEKKGMGSSLLGGIVMTVLLVVVVPIIISILVEPFVTDLIGDTEFAGLTSGAIGAIVMFVILVAFMLFLGGGAILRKYGIIGIAGLIAAYLLLWYFDFVSSMWAWVVPVIIVAILGAVSYLREKKKDK